MRLSKSQSFLPFSFGKGCSFKTLLGCMLGTRGSGMRGHVRGGGDDGGSEGRGGRYAGERYGRPVVFNNLW